MVGYLIQRAPGEAYHMASKQRGAKQWLFAEHVHQEELEKPASDWGLHLPVVTDVFDESELPRVEYYDGIEYVFLRRLHAHGHGRISSHPVLFALGKRSFASISAGELPASQVIEAAVPKRVREHTSNALLLAGIAVCVSEYEAHVAQTSRTIENTANRLRRHEVTNADLIDFVTTEQNLTSFEAVLAGTLQVLQRLLANKQKLLDDDAIDALEDIALQVQQLQASVVSSKASMASIQTTHTTIANNNLNRRIKLLTVFTVMITLPNVAFGMYGMNVALPVAQAPWAFAAVVLATIAVMAVVYLAAKKAKIF